MLKEHGYVRCGAVVPKLKVANIEINVNEIISNMQEAEEKNIQIVCFPELSITGYSCSDLFYQDILIEKAKDGLNQIIEKTKNLNIISILGMPIKFENQLFNTAVVIQKGEILGIVPKTFIPNYAEFYEKRWFASSKNLKQNEIELFNKKVPFGTDLLFKDKENEDICFGIEICEDLWAVEAPSNKIALNGGTIIFNLSASNEILGKNEYRKDLVRTQSAKTISGYVYTSSGINESTQDTVFSGASMIYENGKCLAENERFNFESSLIYSDIDTKRIMNDRIRNISYMGDIDILKYRKVEVEIKDCIENLEREYEEYPFVPNDKKKINEICNEILNIQSYGLAKRLVHTKMNKVVIGISGGLDSTLAFLVAIRAYKILNIPNQNIIAITMPGFGTSSRTYENAKNLIKSYNATLKEIDITKTCIEHFKDIEQDENNHDTTYENAQARERTQILMDIANRENAIVIGTGDLSELALRMVHI